MTDWEKIGRPSERSFRGLLSDPSFFPKLSESDRSEQEIEESSLIDVNWQARILFY